MCPNRVDADLTSLMAECWEQLDLDLQLCSHDLFSTPRSYRLDPAIYMDIYAHHIRRKVVINETYSIYDVKYTAAKNPDILLNFRNGGPMTLIGTNYPGGIENSEGDKHAEGIAFLRELWSELTTQIESVLLDQVTDNAIGNPVQFNFRDGKITTEYISRHIYYLGRMHRLLHLNFGDSQSILEIGGGYGGLAKLFFDFMPNVTYCIVDLPMSLLIEAFFLKQTFPNKKIGTSADFIDSFGPGKSLDRDKFFSFDIVLLPPPFIAIFGENWFDLSINTHSLMEMDVPQIHYYYTHLLRTTRGYFYQCNRKYHKLMDIDPGFSYTCQDWPINHWEICHQQDQFRMKRMTEVVLKKI